MAINFQDPRLQRTRQKMAALSPESGALFDNAAATGQFAKNDMMKQLALMRTGHALKTRRQNFQLRQQERYDRLNLAKDKFKFGKRQGKIATAISALGIIPKAYMGYQAYKQSGKSAEDVMKLAQRIQQSTAGLGG